MFADSFRPKPADAAKGLKMDKGETMKGYGKSAPDDSAPQDSGDDESPEGEAADASGDTEKPGEMGKALMRAIKLGEGDVVEELCRKICGM